MPRKHRSRATAGAQGSRVASAANLRVQGLRAGPERRGREEVLLQGPLGGRIGEPEPL